MKKISILGSTGSIGTQTIEVIQRIDDEFQVKYLSANNNVNHLIQQTKLLNPDAICIVDETKIDMLKTFYLNTMKRNKFAI